MLTKQRPRVLVLGDDMRIFLTVVRSLGRAGIEVHAAPFEADAPALRSKYVFATHALPPYPIDPAQWRRAISALLQKGSFDLVIPCCDRAILALHLSRDELSQYRLAIPNRAAMENLFDKGRTRELAAKLNIPVAVGAELEAKDTSEGLVAEFGLPLAIKPRRSYGLANFDSRGQVAIVRNVQELRAALEKVENRADYLVESFFEGDGIGVSVLADHGAVLQAFQHRRLREGRGGSSARVSETVHPELRAACERVCRDLRFTGVCMFEFRFHRPLRKWVLLETNARFWGSLPLPVALGVNFPLFLHDLLVLNVRHPEVAYRPGIVGRNFGLDGRNLFFGPGGSLQQVGAWATELASFAAQPVHWLTGQERSDTFVRDDLRPAFAECAVLARSAVRKLSRTPAKTFRLGKSAAHG